MLQTNSMASFVALSNYNYHPSWVITEIFDWNWSHTNWEIIFHVYVVSFMLFWALHVWTYQTEFQIGSRKKANKNMHLIKIKIKICKWDFIFITIKFKYSTSQVSQWKWILIVEIVQWDTNYYNHDTNLIINGLVLWVRQAHGSIY